MTTAPLAFLLLVCSLPAQTPSQTPTLPKLPDANPEIVQLAVQDQWDRGNDMFGGREIAPPDRHGKSVAERDEERHVAIRKLLADGKVVSGTDFWLSALIFQHSSKASDVMLAHILAVSAVAKGSQNGKWLAAASLDRYLWDIGQPQVFGTQFKRDAQGKWTMEPYASQSLSDPERAICIWRPQGGWHRSHDQLRRQVVGRSDLSTRFGRAQPPQGSRVRTSDRRVVLPQPVAGSQPHNA